MKSRERVKKVLDHEIPDRLPIDFGSTRTSGITGIAYNNLIKKLGLSTPPPRMYDIVQQLVYPQKDILDLFEADCIDAGQAFYDSDFFWKDFLLKDGSVCKVLKRINVRKNGSTLEIVDEHERVLGIMPSNSFYLDQLFYVYGHLKKFPEKMSLEDYKKDLWAYTTPPPNDIDIFCEKNAQEFKKIIRELYEKTDYAIVLRFGGNLVESGFSIRGMENYLCDLYLDEKGVNRFLDILMEDYIKKLERILKLIGPYVSVIMFADDMGSESGPFFPKEIYRKYFKSRHKKMWDLVHEKSDCNVFLHSCGSIYELIPDFIEAGLDILNPVQITAKEMDPKRLKKQFGKNIIFWGGCCDTRKVLATGSEKTISEHVKNNIEILGKDGGLVFNQIHNIQPDIPPENILALFKSAKRYCTT